MKKLSMVVLAVVLMGGISGCGKTVAELRASTDSIVDNGEQAIVTGVGIASGLIKKAVSLVSAVYEVGKKAVEDSKDNVNTVVNAVSPTATK
jgi:hypothetical protein